MKHGREIRREAIADFDPTARLASDQTHDEVGDFQARIVHGLGHEVALDRQRLAVLFEVEIEVRLLNQVAANDKLFIEALSTCRINSRKLEMTSNCSHCVIKRIARTYQSNDTAATVGAMPLQRAGRLDSFSQFWQLLSDA